MTRAPQRSWRAICLVGVGLAGFGLGAWLLASPEPARPAARAHRPVTPELSGLAWQNRVRIATLRAELEQHPAPPSPTRTAYAPAVISEVKNELEILAVARTMFNRDELLRSELDRLADNPLHVTLAVALAGQPQLASSLFGDAQAEARVYAIGMLRHLAESGDTEWVAAAVDQIGARLNADPAWTKGVELDYVDALAAYLRAVGVDDFLADQAGYYARMHLTERTQLEVQKAVYDSGILRDAPEATLAAVRREFFRFLGKEPPRG